MWPSGSSPLAPGQTGAQGQCPFVTLSCLGQGKRELSTSWPLAPLSFCAQAQLALQLVVIKGASLLPICLQFSGHHPWEYCAWSLGNLIAAGKREGPASLGPCYWGWG